MNSIYDNKKIKIKPAWMEFVRKEKRNRKFDLCGFMYKNDDYHDEDNSLLYKIETQDTIRSRNLARNKFSENGSCLKEYNIDWFP